MAPGYLLNSVLLTRPLQVLSDRFGDCIIGDLGGQFPKNHETTITDYDYDSNSDFEDDEESTSVDHVSTSAGGTGNPVPPPEVDSDSKACV